MSMTRKLVNINRTTGFMLLLIGIMPFLTSCAYLFGGGAKKEYERTANIRWGYFILDILGGGIPLIIDFATGAIYEPKMQRSDAKKEVINALNSNVPAYLVKEDGIYKAYLKDGEVGYTKISEDELPLSVIKSLKAEIEKIKNKS